MTINAYTVTELAGPRVAGRAVKPGQRIELTAEEARFEVLAGHLKLADEASAPAGERPKARESETEHPEGEKPSGEGQAPAKERPAQHKAKK